jgi:hypothetical protein
MRGPSAKRSLPFISANGVTGVARDEQASLSPGFQEGADARQSERRMYNLGIAVRQGQGVKGGHWRRQSPGGRKAPANKA